MTKPLNCLTKYLERDKENIRIGANVSRLLLIQRSFHCNKYISKIFKGIRKRILAQHVIYVSIYKGFHFISVLSFLKVPPGNFPSYFGKETWGWHVSIGYTHITPFSTFKRPKGPTLPIGLKKKIQPKPTNKVLTCLNTQTVNSIPSCLILEVVLLPIAIQNSKDKKTSNKNNYQLSWKYKDER